MMGLAGFRKVRVFRDVTEGIIDNRGNYVYVEVTNKGAEDVDFTPNDFVDQGHIGVPIPIPAGETRGIPMAVYKFTATGNVTVVAYGS